MYSAHIQWYAVRRATTATMRPQQEQHTLMQILKASLLHFALVFGVGFVLGTIHTLWVAPRVGMRIAELMETPIMLVVIIVAARWIVHRLAVPSVPSSRLSMGFVALNSSNWRAPNGNYLPS